MIVPNLFALVASILVLLLFVRKSIPKDYQIANLKQPKDVPIILGNIRQIAY